MENEPPDADAPDDSSSGPAAAPPVVAVVVARAPGEWFEEALEHLVAQDYPNLSILVIDAASDPEVKPRVGAAAPGAFVRRLDSDPGFGAAANEVIEVVDGAAFYLICHDDVALDPDALRRMVEEAFRSNAAVVGPKLVDWDDPRRLQQVGQGMDRFGYGVPLVERGELDQAQHDTVRDVFTVPGACTLVRADLFTEVGGFDEGIVDFLDDVSLCWRAHIAGARVIVAPDARVRCRDHLATDRGMEDRRRLQARHRLRLVLVDYGALSLLWIVPQIAILNLVEVLYALLAGRRRQAGDLVSAWTWNLRRLGEIREARRHVKGLRHVPDREVRHSMVRGSARITQFARGQIGRGEDRFSAVARGSRDTAKALSAGSLRATVTVWTVALLVLLAGSRHLITRGVPAIGEIVSFPESPVDLLRAWASGWRTVGLGSETPNPSAFGLLGALGLGSFGFMGALRTLLVAGLLPLGAWTAYRLPRPMGSRAAQLVALVVYLSIPLPYNALANGRWGALALYAATPTLLGLLARASELAPFGTDHGAMGPGVRRGSFAHHVLAIGAVTGLVACLLPVAIPMVIGMAVALAVGGLVAMAPFGTIRMLSATIAGAGVAFLLHLPWSLDFVLPGTTLTALTGAERGPQPSDLGALLRFEVGPLGGAPIGWAFLVAAALPLFIARAERHSWAVRGWVLALASFGTAWAAQRGSAPFPLPPVEVLLVPAAAGLALATAMGVAAFQIDLPGYRFGWRQLLSGVAGLAVVAAVIPIIGATMDGRWHMPAGDDARALRFIDEEAADLPFRVLWVGDPQALPLAGWQLDEGLAYGTSFDGSPEPDSLWVGSDEGHTGLLADALDLARDGQTVRLGRLLAPMGVRYIVVPERLAPAPFTTEEIPVPPALLATFSAQLDLEALDVPAGLTVYRNEAFAPIRAEVPEGTIPTDGGIAAALGLDLTGAPLALPDDDGYLQWSGPAGGGTSLYHASSSSDRWELEVDGEAVEPVKAFGWSSSYDVPADGDASLRFRTPPLRYGILAIQVVAWLWVLRTLFRQRVAASTARSEAAPPPAHGKGSAPAAAAPPPTEPEPETEIQTEGAAEEGDEE